MTVTSLFVYIGGYKGIFAWKHVKKNRAGYITFSNVVEVPEI